MDIKLNLDGGFEMENGDLKVVDVVDETIMKINRIMRGWLGNCNVRQFSGMRNSRMTADTINTQIDRELKINGLLLSTRIVPIDYDTISIFIMIPGTSNVVYGSIFSFRDGTYQYLVEGSEEAIKYQNRTNIYI